MSDCPCDQLPPLRLQIAAGLDALPRQLRSFPEVRRAMLATLPAEPALLDWRARNSRDLGLMLLEMWAYVSDVLAFYDERIANETYIRTAQRRASLRRLVELIGYVPSPGIAGSMLLAAIADGRGDVTLPAGTGFRSDAFAGQSPQVFEITEPTVINPFKNEWTIGPVQGSTLPQPTPTELANSFVGPASARTFFLYQTAGFALAEEKLAIIITDDLPATAQATRVRSIRSFGAKDGNIYNEVQFEQWIAIRDGMSPVSLQTQKPTAEIKLLVGSALPVPTEVDGKYRVTMTLERETTQLSPGDLVVIRNRTGGNDVLSTAIVKSVSLVTTTVGDPITTTVTIDSGESDTETKTITTPNVRTVTEVTLLMSDDDITPPQLDVPGAEPVLPDSAMFSLHFNMIKGGTVATVAQTDNLGNESIEQYGGLPVVGIVQPPPDASKEPSNPTLAVLRGDFLLSDPDKHGAVVTGSMQFDATGHAKLVVDSGSMSPSDATFKTPLTVMGNLVRATRGETVYNEVLGSGDPRIAGQKFKLKKKPLTYLLANDIDRVSTLKVYVDSVEWREVRTFLSCGPQSRVFVVRHDDNQETFITFGDGAHGARLPSGVGNVLATYRFGSGKAAPPPGAVQQIARPVIGLRSVRSPIGAMAGRDPERPEDLRSTAPRSALLFDRAVSTRDFELVAAQQAGVVKAVAQFTWIEERMAAGVVVRFIGTPSVSALESTLRARAELNLIIDARNAEAIESTLSLGLEIDKSFQPDPVIAAVKAALLDESSGPLSPTNASIGGQFLASPIYRTVQAVPGVVAIRSANLTCKNWYPADLARMEVICVPDEHYFEFDAKTGVDITPLDPTGAVTASRTEGC